MQGRNTRDNKHKLKQKTEYKSKQASSLRQSQIAEQVAQDTVHSMYSGHFQDPTG